MTVRLDRTADEATARWLCHGCGTTYPITGPAFPECACGRRCRMVDADGLPFVGSPEDRLTAAQAEHEKAYKPWLLWLRELRDRLDATVDEKRTPAELAGKPWWSMGRPDYAWTALEAAANYVNHAAEHHDRVAAEVARLEET